MLGLPLLEAMIPGSKRARADGPTTPKRLVFVVFGTGTPDYDAYYGGRPGCFKPASTGPNYEITPILEPIADLRDDIVVVSGLHNNIGRADPLEVGDHRSAAWSILTATHVGLDQVAGISADQVAAQTLGQFTPALPSLFLDSLYEPNSYAEDGWLSWSDPTSPRTRIIDSSEAFLQVFGDTTEDPAVLKKKTAYQKSVLHNAKADVDRIRGKLGKADREKLDQY